MIKITAVLIESLFKTCINLSDVWDRYKTLLEQCQLLSINHVVTEIKIEQVSTYFSFFKQTYSPIYPREIPDDTIFVLAINSEDEIEHYCAEIKADILFISDSKSDYFCEQNLLHDHFRIVTEVCNIRNIEKELGAINSIKKSARKNIDLNLYSDASRDYQLIADKFYSLGLICTARNYYAYAALAAERTEKWRRISCLWYSAFRPLINEQLYDDYNTLEHSYPSISFRKWDSFSELEKKARALQYAAYSDDNHNGPSDSYWIFELAAREYLIADNYERAVECAVSATNRYAQCFHVVSAELMELWSFLLESPKVSEYEDLLLVSFSDIYRNLNLYKSDEADFFYIECKKIQEKKLLHAKKYARYILNKIWSGSTQYGTNISRITILSIILVFLAFPIAYLLCQPVPPDLAKLAFKEAVFSFDFWNHFFLCVVISLDAFFAINTPADATGLFHLLILIETFYAYVALVIISSGIISRLLSQRL